MEHLSGQQEAVAEPATVPGLVITQYEKIVAQAVTATNEILAQIPGYNDDLSNIPKNLRRPVSVEFLAMTVNALEASSELKGVNQLDPMECRDTLQLGQAVRALIDHFNSATRRLELLIRSREVKMGHGALGVYYVSKRVADNPNNTHVAVHVENMKAELRRIGIGRPRKAAPAAPNAPTAPNASSPVVEGGATTKKAA